MGTEGKERRLGIKAQLLGETRPAKDWKINQADYEIVEMVDDEIRRLLEKVEIHSDTPEEQALTPDYLAQQNLGPKYRMKLGESVTWYCSDPYELTHGRIAVMAYVELQGKIVARSYYRSNSHGIWRYLPNYSAAGETIVHYGKGSAGESVTVPIAMQKALAAISSKPESTRSVKNPDFVFVGTARREDDPKARMKATFFHEIELKPRTLAGNFYPPSREEKIAPEKLTFSSEGENPDFLQPLTSWKQETELYGLIQIEVFPSKNGTLHYMFCRDKNERVWIGGIEKIDSSIGSTGLRKAWIDGGDLVTPAFERSHRAGDYGNPSLQKGKYIDMYAHYLQRVPVIGEYWESKTEEGRRKLKDAALRRRTLGERPTGEMPAVKPRK